MLLMNLHVRNYVLITENFNYFINKFNEGK